MRPCAIRGRSVNRATERAGQPDDGNGICLPRRRRTKKDDPKAVLKLARYADRRD